MVGRRCHRTWFDKTSLVMDKVFLCENIFFTDFTSFVEFKIFNKLLSKNEKHISTGDDGEYYECFVTLP